MEIQLERAMTPEDSGWRPCDLCEADFEPRPVMVCLSVTGYEICPECAGALLPRKDRGEVPADWPTWERYQQALRHYPEPMMTSEECDRAAELGLYDDFFVLSQL